VTVGLRPDDLRVLPASDASDQALQGSVVIAEPLGPTTQITVASHGLDLVGMGDGHFLPKTGERVTLRFYPEILHFFGQDGKRLGA